MSTTQTIRPATSESPAEQKVIDTICAAINAAGADWQDVYQDPRILVAVVIDPQQFASIPVRPWIDAEGAEWWDLVRVEWMHHRTILLAHYGWSERA